MHEESLDNKENGPKPLLNTSVLSVLKKLNLFRSPIPLNIRGKNKVVTVLGGAVTIAVVVFLFVQFCIYCNDMFSRESVRMYEIYELEGTPSEVTLSKEDNFFLAVLIMRSDAPVNLSRSTPVAFETSFTHSYRTSDQEITRKRIKYPMLWAPCNRSDILTLGSRFDAYTAYSLANAYCLTKINFTNSTDGTCPEDIAVNYPDCFAPWNLVLKGGYLSDDFHFLQMNLVPCTDSSARSAWNMKCNTSDLRSQFKDVGWTINLYYGNTIIEPKNYHKPSKSFIDTYYWSFSDLSYKITDIYVDRLVVRNYDDFLSATNSRNQTYYTILPDKIREIESYRSVQTSPLMQFNLRRSNLNIITARTYMKLKNVMVRIGGFSKALMTIAAFIVIGYMRYKYLMILSNELYNFKIPSRYSQQPHQKLELPNRAKVYVIHDVSDRREDSNYSPLTSPQPPATTNPAYESNMAVRKYFDHYKKEKLPHSEGQYFRNLLYGLCKKKPIEEQLAIKARQNVVEDLDIVKIMRKLVEVEKLKILLMNPNQRRIFESYEKPLVCLNEKKKLIHLNTMKAYVRSEVESPARRRGNVLEDEKKTYDEIQKKVLEDREEFNSLSQYARLYMAYRHLKNDPDPANEKYNKRLLPMIGQNLLEAFDRMDKILGDNVTPQRFENMINKILQNAREDRWYPLAG